MALKRAQMLATYLSRPSSLSRCYGAERGLRGFSTDQQPSTPTDMERVRNLARSWVQLKAKEIREGLREAPPMARALGFGGAIPFVALAPPLAYMLPLPDVLSSSYADAQAAYGALILSFLGGPHWGLAMEMKNGSSSSIGNLTTSSARYLWSVTPCLLAWLALLLPPVAKFEILLSSFALALGVDFAMVKSKLLPSWYLPLRIILTTIAMISMGSTLLLGAAKKTLEAAKEKIQA